MSVKRIAACTHRHLSSTVYDWSEIATFFLPFAFNASLGYSHWNSWKKLGPQKTRIMGLPGSEDSLTIG